MNILGRVLFGPILPLLTLSLLISACGGGGGGGSPSPGVTTPAPPPPPPAPPPPPPPPPPVTPSTTGSEYLRSWGLAAIHVDAAYRAGATGVGIIVAVVDSGIDLAQPDMVGVILPASTDIISSRGMVGGEDRHGTRVAGIIAANFNGTGTVGVAYGAKILSIRADGVAGGTPTCPTCVYASSDLARSLDYAVANGARVINLSLGGETPLSGTFEAALARAVASGAVVTASAGNDGNAESNWPARYAVDFRFAGSVVAVGALAQDGTLASFSNKAGVSANGYLAAPGEQVVTDCGPDNCWRVSGTSFAAPHVSGALALLLEAFPGLSGRDAVDILLRTAADRGEPGTDSTFGRGALDLTRAFEPVGTSSLPLAAGGATPIPGPAPGVHLGSAFGESFAQGDALRTVILDDYQRRFSVDLAGSLPRQQSRSLVTAEPIQRSSALVLGGPGMGGATLAFAVEAPVFEDRPQETPPERLLGPQPMRSARFSGAFGRLSLASWRGEGGAVAPGGIGGRDAFQSIAQPDRLTQAAVRFGNFTLQAEQGAADRRQPFQIAELQATRYVSATGQLALGWGVASLSAGALDEPLGPLGSFMTSGSLFALPTRTRYAAAAFDLAPAPAIRVRAELALGRSDAAGVLMGVEDATSSSWRLSGVAGCAAIGWSCSRITVSLAQPMRIEGGAVVATLADVPLAYEDPLTFSRRRFSAAPDGRELEIEVGMEQSYGAAGLFGLRTNLALQPGHRVGAAPEIGAIASWRTRF